MHKWWHFLFTTWEQKGWKKSLMYGGGKTLEHYDIHIDKCDKCKQWKLKVTDHHNAKQHDLKWMPVNEALEWLKNNEYNRG
jgi:hypothetical protein